MIDSAPLEWQRDGCTVSSDDSRLDLARITAWLAQESYWAEGRSRDTVERSIRHSLCFGLYDADGAQLGFARVVTDRTTFAWLCDVFVEASARGRGLGSWLVGCALEHPDLQDVRRWMLATRDAHEVYSRLGFRPLSGIDRWMAIERPR